MNLESRLFWGGGTRASESVRLRSRCVGVAGPARVRTCRYGIALAGAIMGLMAYRPWFPPSCEVGYNPVRNSFNNRPQWASMRDLPMNLEYAVSILPAVQACSRHRTFKRPPASM